MITLVEVGNSPPFLPMLPQNAAQQLERPDVLALGQVEGDNACGAALSVFRPQGAELIGLYVAGNWRRQGRATALLEEMAAAARRCGLGSLEMVSHSQFDDLNAFLEAKGFAAQRRSSIFTVRLDALSSSKTLSSSSADAGAFVPLADLPDITLRQLNRTMEEDPDSPLAFVDMETTDTTVSMAYVLNGAIAACAWFSHGDGVLAMDGLYQGTDDRYVLLALLRCCLKAVGKKYPSDTLVQFTALNELVERLLRTFLKEMDFTEEAIVRYVMELEPEPA